MTSLTNCLIIVTIVLLLSDIGSSQKSKNVKQVKPIKKTKDVKDVVKKEIPFVQKFYSKAYGEIKFDRKRIRYPAKGSILECVVKCYATTNCICARINAQTNECDTFVANKDDPNAERNQTIIDNYVYFSSTGGRQDLGENISVGKKVTQSSTYNQYKAQKAFDNNMKTESKTSGGNIKRKTGLPWLQVDLKDEYVITGVTLLSKDVKSLHDFEIRVGNRQLSGVGKGVQFKDNPLCYGYVGDDFLKDSEPKTVKCEPCPLSGRYVTIQIVNDCSDCPNPGENYLNLSEVQVFGYSSK